MTECKRTLAAVFFTVGLAMFLKNWKPSDLPAWLTRDVYIERVQPALAQVAKTRIRAALGVSEPYSSAIQAGHVPHARHWQALAELVGVSPDGSRHQPE